MVNHAPVTVSDKFTLNVSQKSGWWLEYESPSVVVVSGRRFHYYRPNAEIYVALAFPASSSATCSLINSV
jgi:hypothetical protein